MKNRVLVVEDDQDLRELMVYNLSKKGLEVMPTNSSEEALPILRRGGVQVVVLDVMLPGMDGFDFCRLLKTDSKTKHIPVLMVTALSEASDIVSGLELGAEDYLTKPFSPAVLVARVRALLRRSHEAKAVDLSPVVFNDLEIHPGRHQVLAGGSEIPLSLTEFRILLYLAKSPGWVFTRYQILDEVRGEEVITTDRVVDVHVAGLRRKLGHYGYCVETVRGIGYRFRIPGDVNISSNLTEPN